MNCRGCHLVDDAKMTPGGGNRSYADFARHSPIPAREDGRTETPRNSPALVNATLERGRPFFLHFDGEFPSTVALAEGTFTGRNFGWLPGERALAVANMADVIRGDDGTGALAQAFDGGPYRRVLAGTDPAIPKDFRLPKKFRIDVDRASDEQILRAVARLVAASGGIRCGARRRRLRGPRDSRSDDPQRGPRPVSPGDGGAPAGARAVPRTGVRRRAGPHGSEDVEHLPQPGLREPPPAE
jgi:hypothetical protein